MSLSADIQTIEAQIDAAEHEARALIDGLSEHHGTWRPAPQSWSVSECLDHLATTNRIYVGAMLDSFAGARPDAKPAVPSSKLNGAGFESVETLQMSRGSARPGWVGALFVRSLEPPVKLRIKAPAKVCPRPSPPLSDAFAAFIEAQNQVRVFLLEHGSLDLSVLRFRNPFVRRVRLSIATGLHVIAAHERRHLWQAWNVRRQAEAASMRASI